MDRSKSPSLNKIESIVMLEPEHEVLPHNIEIYTFDGCPESVVQVEIVFPYGTKYQSRPLQASFAAEMLLEGAGGKSGTQIMEVLDGYGAYIESGASFDEIVLSIFCTNRYLAPVLNVIKDVLTTPNFDASAFDIYRSNRKQSYLLQSEKVSVLARRTFYKTLFKDHPYGNFAELEDFDAISVDDCKQFYTDYLAQTPFDVFVSGQISKEVENVLKTSFESYKQRGGVKTKPFAKLKPKLDDNLINVEKSGVQTGIRMGQISIDRCHEDYPALQVLMVTLGGYFGSRLMRNIREDKGYTYGIGGGLVSHESGGLMYIATEAGNQYVDDVVSEVNKEINLLQKNNIPDNELDTVKNYMLGSLARSSDGAFSMMERYRSVRTSGLLLDYYERYIETINNVSADELKNLAKKHLVIDQFVTVLAGEKQRS